MKEGLGDMTGAEGLGYNIGDYQFDIRVDSGFENEDLQAGSTTSYWHCGTAQTPNFGNMLCIPTTK